jgi:hypothetical protein
MWSQLKNKIDVTQWKERIGKTKQKSICHLLEILIKQKPPWYSMP